MDKLQSEWRPRWSRKWLQFPQHTQMLSSLHSRKNREGGWGVVKLVDAKKEITFDNIALQQRRSIYELQAPGDGDGNGDGDGDVDGSDYGDGEDHDGGDGDAGGGGDQGVEW